jgi:hypothetical protein
MQRPIRNKNGSGDHAVLNHCREIKGCIYSFKLSWEYIKQTIYLVMELII